MAEILDDNLNKPYKGLHTDNVPSEQPKETYRFALNAVNETSEGEQNSISNEGSNISTTNLPEGYHPIGEVYMNSNTSVIFSVNPLLKKSEIGLLSKDDVYSSLVNTAILNFNIRNQIDVQFRVRKANERYIYWVDGLNKARSFNIDNPYAYYSNLYKDYLAAGGDPNTFTGEKWSPTAFELIKSYTRIPRFIDVEIVPYGAIVAGSYSFAVQYIDEDNNPTEWITESNDVRIFNDQESSPFPNIRGSRNSQNAVQSYPPSNKSIRITLSNMDENFPFYRVAVIQKNGSTGKPVKALALPKKSINTPIFTYSGNNDQLAEVPLTDIAIDPEVILAPEHIEQLENRLLLANTKGPQYNWCDFQQYASKIGADLVTEPVILNSIESQPNLKNAHSKFVLSGYMPGDVYSFGIMYLMKDNTYSPVFPIPGKANNNTTSRMDYYELANLNYEDIHNCNGTTNYWGRDYNNNLLRNTKVRMHKFPSRAEAGIPLIESSDTTSTITKYRLKYKFSLAPGKTYPLDINGDPLAIDLVINYLPIGSTVPESYSTVLIEGDLANPPIIFYDSPIDVQAVYSQLNDPHFQFDPTSTFWTTYMVPGNETFTIDAIYESYILDTIYNTTTSNIFGIEFLDIEKPHPDVIGFFIVRNERLDTDKLIVDNAIMGTNIKMNDYSSFTHICTEFPSTYYDNRASWFFSPEHQFYGKNPQFSQMRIEGFYTATNKYTPQCTTDHPCDAMKDKENPNDPIPGSAFYNAITVRDVMPGTSYNPEIDKKNSRDTDGFALVIPYRARDFEYNLNNTYSPILRDDIFYLGATANKVEDGINFFNVSCDNKIAFIKFQNPIDPTDIYTANSPNNTMTYSVDARTQFTAATPAIKRLAYVSLFNDNRTAYEDFMVRDYFKEHHNAVLFGNLIEVPSFRVFNGDTQISALNFVTTMFNKIDFAERAKKRKWWQIVLGAVLIVVGVIINVIPAVGQALSAISLAGAAAVLSLTAIGIGVSLISSGIKFEQMKNMIENDYDKGLLQAVNDWDVSGMVDAGPLGAELPNVNLGDDNIQWFADRANNIYIESSVPFGLRCGITAGVPDFINAPDQYKDDEYRNYLIEKLTVIDRDQGAGRLYRGFPVSEIYDINLDYVGTNKQKIYIALPETYDCCAKQSEEYPLRVWYSQQSFQEEQTDNYRTFLPLSYRDIEGEHGVITDLYKVGSNLYIHTTEALWQLPQNLQERVTSELVSFIGTGDFFAIPPKKIIDDELGSAGCQHKWATVKTKAGVFFLNEIEGRPYLQAEGIKDLSPGNRNWFKNNLRSNLILQIFRKTGIIIDIDNNPANKNGVGYLATYDARHERVVFTKKDYLLRPEFYSQVTVEPNIIAAPYDQLYFDIEYGAFCIRTLKPGPGLFWIRHVIDLTNTAYFINRSWTISYSIHTDSWCSWHSYLPNFYLHNQENFFSTIYDSTGMWRHNEISTYQSFYGVTYPHILEYVSASNPVQTRIWNDMTLITSAKSYSIGTGQYVEVPDVTFNKLICYNERQSTGELILKVKEETEDYLFNQVQNNIGEIIIDRNEGNWNVNELRDYRVNYLTPIFTTEWDAIKDVYPIDKVINETAIDHNKDWNETESLRDKYLIVRLKFDNFVTIKLTTNYSIEGEQISFR